MKLSIVIVSYNGREHLRTCLASLSRYLDDPECEVIVVDNASKDGSAQMVAEEFPQARLFALPTNTGFAAGANRGAQESKGEAIVFLNPDSEVASDVFGPMLEHLGAHPEIGILAPKLIDADGSLQLSCRRFPGFATALFNRYSLLTRLLPRNRFSTRYLLTDWDHNAISDVDWVSGACMMVRRSLLDEVGPLDEAFFFSLEDVDFCQRTHRAGYRVVYFPQVEVMHHIGGSSRTVAMRTVIARHRSMWRYYKKYMRRNFAVDAAVAAGISLRCGWLLLLNAAKQAIGAVRGRGST
ncbi:MAG: glycosyltransferase family 2 protein [Dehalococcoidia bacterium]|nr:glycosyltransferase family 2 protein [Dehalococcoidia bacterium]